MTKLVVILMAGLILEAIGVVFLSAGLKDVDGIKAINTAEIARVVVSGVTNGKILFGIFLLTIFFGTLLYMLSSHDVSLIWPLTSLGFVITTFAAKMFLHEQVSAVRWAGVILIVIGAGLGIYSDKPKEAKSSPAAAHDQPQQPPQSQT